MDQNDRLFGHDRDMTSHLLLLCKDLSEEQWNHEYDVGHRTVKATWNHMIGSTMMWTSSMADSPFEWQDTEWGYDDLVKQHRIAYAQFEELARAVIADGRLDETFPDPWNVRRSFGSTILHVTLHNHNHRTEVLHILERLGVQNLPEGDPLEWEWQLRTDGKLPPV